VQPQSGDFCFLSIHGDLKMNCERESVAEERLLTKSSVTQCARPFQQRGERSPHEDNLKCHECEQNAGDGEHSLM
jgi:predicted molibdopterin-dependent oxidoreductase YjgC